jgi:hypothetical protein
LPDFKVIRPRGPAMIKSTPAGRSTRQCTYPKIFWKDENKCANCGERTTAHGSQYLITKISRPRVGKLGLGDVGAI